MSIEERFALFWREQAFRHLKGCEIALWFALLELRRDRGEPERIEVSNATLCTMIGVDIRTLRAARRGLVQKYAITFKSGVGRKSPTYALTACSSLEQLAELIASPIPIGEKPEKPKPKAKAEQPPKKEKPKTIEQSLFKPEKPKPKAKAEQPPPTLEEVSEVFISKGYTLKDAEGFYFYYDAQGWVTASGQKIKRLDSAVNRWLSYDNRKNHGTTTSNNKPSRTDEVVEYVRSGFKK